MKRERERSSRRESDRGRGGRERGEEDNPATVSTLYVRNLPADVKERELRLLACFLPGFESAMVNTKDNVPIGFIKFSSQAYALSACASLQNFLFDKNDSDTCLQVSLARRDMNVRSSSRGNLTSMAFPSSFSPASSSSLNPLSQTLPFAAFPYAMGAFPSGENPLAAYASAFSAALSQVQRAAEATTPRGLISSKLVFTIDAKLDGDPCDTLCLQGIPAEATQEDLNIFARLEGYRCQKFLSSKALAFLKYESEASAANALDTMSGKTLAFSASSSNRRTLILEYAKRSLEVRE